MNEAQRLARLVLIVGAIWSGSFALLAPPDTPPIVALDGAGVTMLRCPTAGDAERLIAAYGATLVPGLTTAMYDELVRVEGS